MPTEFGVYHEGSNDAHHHGILRILRGPRGAAAISGGLAHVPVAVGHDLAFSAFEDHHTCRVMSRLVKVSTVAVAATGRVAVPEEFHHFFQGCLDFLDLDGFRVVFVALYSYDFPPYAGPATVPVGL